MDVVLTVYDRILALIGQDEDAARLLRPGNVIDLRNPNWTNDRDVKRSAGDMPLLRVEIPEETVNQRNNVRFFGQTVQNFSAGDCDYGVPMRLTYTLILVHETLDLRRQRELEYGIERALMRWGPRMALPWVSNSELRARRTTEKSADTGKQLRTVWRGTLTVDARPKLSQLTDVTPGVAQTLPAELE